MNQTVKNPLVSSIQIRTNIKRFVASDTSRPCKNSQQFGDNFWSYQQNWYDCPYPATVKIHASGIVIRVIPEIQAFVASYTCHLSKKIR